MLDQIDRYAEMLDNDYENPLLEGLKQGFYAASFDNSYYCTSDEDRPNDEEILRQNRGGCGCVLQTVLRTHASDAQAFAAVPPNFLYGSIEERSCFLHVTGERNKVKAGANMKISGRKGRM